MQENLNNYIQEEKIELLGNPLPVMKEDINWKADNLNFEFELGLAPKFAVKVKGKKAVTHFQIEADKKMIDEQLGIFKNNTVKLNHNPPLKMGLN